MERRVAIVGTVAAAIVETAAHRRVTAETQFRQYRRAIGPETVAPGAINRRRDVEPVADRLAQRRHLRPQQFGRKIPGIAVVLLPPLVMRRGNPRRELRADIPPPRAPPR